MKKAKIDNLLMLNCCPVELPYSIDSYFHSFLSDLMEILSRPSSQCEGDFVKNQEKLTNFRKIEKMEKWKIDFLEICNFSKKSKKKNERKIRKLQKNRRGRRQPC